ncbi:MAG: hypothetical protein IKY83_14795 [Proteobacteria bacterium]|nr:hypothetical protein [Pseudomonadota bacterium]
MNRLMIPAVAAALLTTACAWIDDVGKEKSTAEFRLTPAEPLETDLECAAKQFPVTFEFFDLDTPSDAITHIRMYTAYPDALWSQHALITFAHTDASTLEKCPPIQDFIGTAQPLTRDGCIRMAIQINACQPQVTARVIGTLMLDAFSDKRGEYVKGSVEGTLVYFESVTGATETAEKQVTLGALDGEFSFVNHAGAVWN